MTKQYYVVTNGRHRGIFETKEECTKQVYRFPHAQYKTFTSLTEAQTFYQDYLLSFLKTEAQAQEQKWHNQHSFVGTRTRTHNNKFIHRIQKKKRQA